MNIIVIFFPQEKETEKYVNHVMHGNAPYHCQGKHLEWYEHMYYRMFGK